MSRRASPDKCPLCGDRTVREFAPFCGRGCKDRDLLNWLGEGYRVPGQPVDPQLASFGDSGLDSGDGPD